MSRYRHARRFLDEPSTARTPSLLVDEVLLHQNIAEMASNARSLGVSLRPHIKTHKSVNIANLQVAAGAVGIMCAKLGEAEVFAEGGIEDIAIGFPVIGDLKISRLLKVMERARIIVALDSLAAAEALSAAMVASDRILEIYLEVDTGHHRTGTLAGEPTRALALKVARLPGVRLIGIMTHEGHANAAPPETIRETALNAGELLVETAESIRSSGVPLETVSVGSTPCASYTPTIGGVTEMRPGTYVFRDVSGFRHGVYGPDRCALHYLATVASRPSSDRAVLDAGAKTLALDTGPSHPGHGYVVDNPDVIIDRLSEEHGVVLLPPETTGWQVGDIVEIIPNHVCTSVNLHDRMLIVRDGKVIDEWQVGARGRVS
ncbi:alanine racemase [soil metagenome]